MKYMRDAEDGGIEITTVANGWVVRVSATPGSNTAVEVEMATKLGQGMRNMQAAMEKAEGHEDWKGPQEDADAELGGAMMEAMSPALGMEIPPEPKSFVFIEHGKMMDFVGRLTAAEERDAMEGHQDAQS